METNSDLARSIAEHSRLSEDQLLAELGRNVEELEKEPFANAARLAVPAPPPADTSALAGPFADRLKAIGMRFLNRYNHTLYSIMCNPNDPDNPKVREALITSSESAGLVIGGVLLAHLAWLPGIVAIVGSLIIKRFARDTYDEACKMWGEELS